MIGSHKVYKSYQGVRHVLLAALLLLVACSSDPGDATSPQKELSKHSTGALTPMQVETQSRSLILRATHVLLVKIVAATSQEWTKRKAGGEERVVALELQLTEVIKGGIDQKTGETIPIEVKQVKLGEAWGPMPGVWSQVTIDIDNQLAAFCISKSRDAQSLLNEPAAVELVPANEALPDLRLAAQAADLGLTKLLAAAKGEAGSLGYLFADFLWASYEGEALSDSSSYEEILQALEWPELSTVARSTWLMTIPDSVLAEEPVASKQINRLAVTMVRILAMPSAKVLHDNIASTFLPNLVDAENSESASPEDVFADYPQAREKLMESIKTYEGIDAFKALTTWAKR